MFIIYNHKCTKKPEEEVIGLCLFLGVYDIAKCDMRYQKYFPISKSSI